MHLCECWYLCSTPPPVPGTTWWRKSIGGGQGGGCEGIRQPVPSLPSSPRLALCDLITRPLAGTAALMLPEPANKFAFPSSKGKQPHLWGGRAQLHITYV